MIDIPWTNEIITRIYNEKMAWINNAKISDEERKIEIAKLDEWKAKVSENVPSEK